MIYLSFDIEATGLRENDLIIEFACIPFSTDSKMLFEEYTFHQYIKCPSFLDLKPTLDPWVIQNNQTLIEKAHNEGSELSDFKDQFELYIKNIKSSVFSNKKITLFGKSMSAIDLPFLNRDLGWDFMRQYFEHRQLDLSSVAYSMIDLGHLPAECESGSTLMRHLSFGEVAHTALEDAVNTAKMYLKILELYSKS